MFPVGPGLQLATCRGLVCSQPHPSDAPWCGHCKELAPEYSKAAALLAAESAVVTLAKVDGPAEPELTKEFEVVGYPTLKFFQNGNHTNPEEYAGTRWASTQVWSRCGLGMGQKSSLKRRFLCRAQDC